MLDRDRLSVHLSRCLVIFEAVVMSSEAAFRWAPCSQFTRPTPAGVVFATVEAASFPAPLEEEGEEKCSKSSEE